MLAKRLQNATPRRRRRGSTVARAAAIVSLLLVGTGPASAEAPSVADLLARAEARNDPRLSEALEAVYELDGDDGYGSSLQVASAALFGAIGQYWIAEQLLEGALAAAPNGPWAHYARLGVGLMEVARGNYDQSAAIFRSIAEAESGSRNAAEALLALGWQQTLLGRQDDAISSFGELVAHGYEPEVESNARLSIAQNLLRAGRLDEAAAMLEDLRHEPGSALADDALRDLAWTRYEQGDLDAAENLFKEVITKYDRGLHHGSADDLPDWRHMSRMSPRALARKMGQMALSHIRSLDRPLDAFLVLQNRSAARDAAEALKVIARTRQQRISAPTPALRDSRPKEGEHFPRDAEHADDPGTVDSAPLQHRIAAADVGLWLLLVCTALGAWWVLSGVPRSHPKPRLTSPPRS